MTDGKVTSAEISLATAEVNELLAAATPDFLSSISDVERALEIPGVCGVDGGVVGEQMMEGVPIVTPSSAVAAAAATVTESPAAAMMATTFGVEDNFGEVFTDLSDFLLQSVGDLNVLQVPEQNTTAAAAPSRKRTATEALLDAMETTSSSSGQVVPSSPVDHLGYTLQAKRSKRVVRHSTVDDDDYNDDEIPSTSMDGNGNKTAERRIKNNIASKRSREIRKQKFLDQEAEVERLKKANEQLKAQIAEKEKLTERMKAALVKRLARK